MGGAVPARGPTSTKERVPMKKLLAAAAMFLGLTGAASADNLHWEIRSLHPNIVYLEFYSQNRSYVWPGGTESWVLKDSNFHSFNLACNTGEKICFGAWVAG